MIETIKEIFKRYKPQEVVNSILDLGQYYVVNLTRDGLSDDEFVLDNLYRVDKRTFSIKEFAVSDDRQSYLKSLKHPIYIKNKTK